MERFTTSRLRRVPNRLDWRKIVDELNIQPVFICADQVIISLPGIHLKNISR